MTDQPHWPDCWKDPAHHACAVERVEFEVTRSANTVRHQEDIRKTHNEEWKNWHDMMVALERERDLAVQEINRLRAVLRRTHEQYCTNSWTDRGLHAPGCLLYEMEPEE